MKMWYNKIWNNSLKKCKIKLNWLTKNKKYKITKINNN